MDPFWIAWETGYIEAELPSVLLTSHPRPRITGVFLVEIDSYASASDVYLGA